MTPDHRARSAHAFTLIELLTVLVVVAILASIGLGSIRSSKNRTAIARAKSELSAIATALEDYKRFYGDYPRLGVGGGITQAAIELTSALTTGPGLRTVQSCLFNCLTGVYGPLAFGNSDRQNGPNFIDTGNFSLEGTLSVRFLIPSLNPPNPPFKSAENVGLLDPWGRRYLYFYKTVALPIAWQSPSYVLYSVGPDGRQDSVPPLTGILTRAQLSTANNADNIYANP